MSQVPTETRSPGCFVDPSQTATFTFAGQTISAQAGQSIGAALYAAGERVFTRSFKYHRPRGLLCVSGDCPNCLMNVDGKPNVRTCVEPVREGQVVTPQNVWPRLGFDVLRVFDRFDQFLPVGFYYKRFHKPRWLWPILEPFIRNIAGLGKIEVDKVYDQNASVEHFHTDICVIGAGPAGLAAAETAAQAGARTLLLDRQPRPGGRYLFEENGPDHLEKMLAALQGQTRLHILSGTSVFGLYEGNLIGAFQGDRFRKIRARQIIVCTGGRQRPFLFPNNDLPGIFLGDGVLRLARGHGVIPGRRAVVATDNRGGHHLAGQLRQLGIEVVAVVDARAQVPSDGVTISGSVIVNALGNKHLKAIQVAPVQGSGVGQVSQTITCDLLCLASERIPANELLLQTGWRYRQENGQWLPQRMVPGVLGAGTVTGNRSRSSQVQDGRLRGAEAASALGFANITDFGFSVVDFPADETELSSTSSSLCHGQSPCPGKAFVCLCEDVTEKDLHHAVAEGFDGIEPLKRYSTVSMGPCQGKVCNLTSSEVCARANKKNVNEVGTTTSRPPAIPVELGVLAAEQRHPPVRRTPLHHWHQSAGAVWMDAGAWKRPESYGDVAAEVEAVRTRVGLIDVSTLGKIELRGKDAAELLERIYLNSWKDLKVGRARYGMMCTEEGVLFDDGVGARLGQDHFFLTATTGNADAVWQWLEMWRITWGLEVAIQNQTTGMAAMNLAGPRSRDVLASVTDLDVSSGAFPHLAMREGKIAGVTCRIMRLGFVSDLGFEIHCSASLALEVWQTLVKAGEALGLRPFGVESQRVLRLEKGHFIIGQDTDALSLPLDAGLEWAVKFNKPVFHGREPLLRLKEMGSRSRLVGFSLVNESSLRFPPNLRRDWEGCQVVESGQPVGRVTSLRFSPTLGRSIGLAWVPAGSSAVGNRFQIRWNNLDVTAEVTALPFYKEARSETESAKNSLPSQEGIRPMALSPLQAWHDGHNVRWMEYHGWRVPAVYSNVEAETRAAQTSLALADLSWLTKISIRGKNLIRSLMGDGDFKPGLVRFQAANSFWVCSLTWEQGILLSVSPNFLGNLQNHPEYQPEIVYDVSASYTGLGLFGPDYAKVLRGLTSFPIAPEVFPSGACAETGLAGVHALLARFPDTVPGVCIFVARDVAEYVWERIHQVAGPGKIVPLGLEGLKSLWSL